MSVSVFQNIGYRFGISVYRPAKTITQQGIGPFRRKESTHGNGIQKKVTAEIVRHDNYGPRVRTRTVNDVGKMFSSEVSK